MKTFQRIRLKKFNCIVAIMITHPCNLFPLASHVYIVKLGFTGYTFFLISYLNEAVLMVPAIYVLSKNKKHIKIFQLKIIIFGS